MSDVSNVIHSAEEEKARADEVYHNPRIVQAYKQALKEETLIDKLLELVGVQTHQFENRVNSHLGKDDVKLLDDYLSAKRDVAAQDRPKADLVRSSAEDDFIHNVTGCRNQRSSSRTGRGV